MTEKRKLLLLEILGFVWTFILLFGSFLPWFDFEKMDVTFPVKGMIGTKWGYQGDGLIFFAVAMVILLILYIGYIKNMRIESGFGILLISIMLYLLIQVELGLASLTIKGDNLMYRVGVGIYLIGLATIGLFFISFLLIWDGYKLRNKSFNSNR